MLRGGLVWDTAARPLWQAFYFRSLFWSFYLSFYLKFRLSLKREVLREKESKREAEKRPFATRSFITHPLYVS